METFSLFHSVRSDGYYYWHKVYQVDDITYFALTSIFFFHPRTDIDITGVWGLAM